MQGKLDISENQSRVTFFETENKKILTISAHFKTTKTVVENGYFLKRVRQKEAPLESSRTSR